MSDQRQDSLRCRPDDQGMSIHTRKITDSCRDKDCIEDLRVYLPCPGQSVLESASHVRVRSAELIHTGIQVQPVAFDRTHYCVDVTFYYRIQVDCILGTERPTTLYGLSVFSKRVVLCGEDSRAHTYRSDDPSLCAENRLTAGNSPAAVVDVLDPMVLSCRVRDVCECRCDDSCLHIPQKIRSQFDDELVMGNEHRRLYVSLGQFSIIRLERDAQLVVPVLAYSIPIKECTDSDANPEDPCEMFAKIPFPTSQFSPRNCDQKNDCSGKPGCRTC